jgi:hypothetical protein
MPIFFISIVLGLGFMCMTFMVSIVLGACRRGINFYVIIIYMSIYNVVTKCFRMNISYGYHRLVK